MNIPIDQEIWRAINEFPNYQVSSHGRVRNTKNGRILKNTLNPKGYLIIGLRKNRREYKMLIHRLIAQEFIGNPQAYRCVDHIDRNPLNNAIINLRFCSYTTNNQNKKKQLNCSSKLYGVQVCGKKFRARITNPNTHKIEHIGCFSDEEEAGRAYDEKARELYGNQARTNF